MSDIQKTVYVPSMVVFTAVMAVVVISFFMSRNANEREFVAETETYQQRSEDAVRDRLTLFEETLRAGVGVLEGDDTVTQTEWSRFIDASAVVKRYPGAVTVGYAQVVPNEKRADFLKQASALGESGLVIYPSGQRAEYVPILYVAPHTDEYSKVVGFDVISEQARAEAIAIARDTGEASLTRPVESLTDKSDEGTSFIMYMPQYRFNFPRETEQQRRDAIKGYVYVGFRVKSFMESVSSDQSGRGRAFSVSIGKDQRPMYRTAGFDTISSGKHRRVVSDVAIGGTTMTFNYVYDEGSVLPGYINSRSVAILVFGTVTALLIAGAVWLTLLGKSNQLLLEKERGVNEAKDNLLSIASHQLRTPATGVKQYLGLLLQGFSGELTSQQRMLLDKAYASNERQLKTINEILYLARLDAGRIVLSKKSFSITSIVRDAVNELSDQIQVKGHVVKLKVPSRQKMYYGDEHMIRMAVENLLTNAVKYTHQKGVITVRVMLGKELKIIVEDNGVGIPEEKQQEMFNQFVRIDNDLSVVVGGTGIGLYVVQHIVELHGGHISVDSRLGKGSKFTIHLPFVEPEGDR